MSHEQGIEGKKGVLWWQINDILKAKKPKFVLLENVDRLLKAPSKQRGQAFGIILRCFCEAGYGVQWRVINAAEYGHPQRRRRTFIFAFHNSTKYYKTFKNTAKRTNPDEVIINNMMFSAGFPCRVTGDVNLGSLAKDSFKSIADISDKFAFRFENAGYCLNYNIFTTSVEPIYEGRVRTLGECLDCNNVPEYCYDVDYEKFRYLKGAKHIERTAKNGHNYFYSEGPIAFPDYLDRPGRTMLTSEGTVNRSSHYILDPVSNRYRILTPIECERLDEFPDDWTNTGMSPKRRYFIAFRETEKGYVLDNAAFYNFPETIVDEFVGYTYRKTQKTLLEENIVKSTSWKKVKGEIKLIHNTNFVGSKENPVCHVRPHAADFNDQSPLPVPDKYTGYTSYEKQCFWIDTRFINAILRKTEKEYLDVARKKLNSKN